MKEKLVDTENKSELNPDQMEQVCGGTNLLIVACGGCGKHFTINRDTTEYKCVCGYKNRFDG